MKQRALIAVKDETSAHLIQIGTTPSTQKYRQWVKNDPNFRLSMELNCRPQLKSFELKLLKIWAIFKYINSLLEKETHDTIFSKKNMSKIPR
jgi:hypothetical protein